MAEVTSKLSTFQFEKVSASPPALKLPQLFSATPNSHKRLAPAAQISQIENFSERKPLEQPLSNNHINDLPQGLLFVLALKFHFMYNCWLLEGLPFYAWLHYGLWNSFMMQDFDI